MLTPKKYVVASNGVCKLAGIFNTCDTIGDGQDRAEQRKDDERLCAKLELLGVIILCQCTLPNLSTRITS